MLRLREMSVTFPLKNYHTRVPHCMKLLMLIENAVDLVKVIVMSFVFGMPSGSLA